MPQLVPIEFLAPGSLGLNSEDSLTRINRQYALKANNAVIDSNGTLATRKGTISRTTTAAASEVNTIHAARFDDGTTATLVATGDSISTSLTDPDANQILTGQSFTKYKMVNFNDKVYIIPRNGRTSTSQYWEWTGTGNATSVIQTDGQPHIGIMMAAFGRIWRVRSTDQGVQYSALLIGEDFSTASGGGEINVEQVWTQGEDVITGIAAFNGMLVIFGERHIILYTDGQGSATGIDPTQIYVVDIIEGVGCIAPDSIQNIGETDLLFLSERGVESLSRLLIQKSNPLISLSKKVRSELINDIGAITDPLMDVNSVYSPESGFYLLSFDNAGEASKTYCVDTRRLYQDDDGDVLARITTWSLSPRALARGPDKKILMSGAVTGEVVEYAGVDDEGTSFTFEYLSPWDDLSELDASIGSREKILKLIGTILNVGNVSNITFSTRFNFDTDSPREQTRTYTPDAISEWGEAEWGVDEWGGLEVMVKSWPGFGRGQWFQIGVTKDDGDLLALQLIELYFKIGRLSA